MTETKQRESDDAPYEYDCFACKGHFTAGWSQAEARAEFEQNFPGLKFDTTAKDEVCDDCYKLIMADADDEPTNDLRGKVRENLNESARSN